MAQAQAQIQAQDALSLSFDAIVPIRARSSHDAFLLHGYDVPAARLNQLAQALQENGMLHDCYFDTNETVPTSTKLTGQMLAIDSSTCVVVLFSNKLIAEICGEDHESSCQRLFIYALLRKSGRHVVAAKIEDCLPQKKWKGLLGQALGNVDTHPLLDLTALLGGSDDELAHSSATLCRAVVENLNQNHHHHHRHHHPHHGSVPQKSDISIEKEQEPVRSRSSLDLLKEQLTQERTKHSRSNSPALSDEGSHSAADDRAQQVVQEFKDRMDALRQVLKVKKRNPAVAMRRPTVAGLDLVHILDEDDEEISSLTALERWSLPPGIEPLVSLKMYTTQDGSFVLKKDWYSMSERKHIYLPAGTRVYKIDGKSVAGWSVSKAMEALSNSERREIVCLAPRSSRLDDAQDYAQIYAQDDEFADGPAEPNGEITPIRRRSLLNISPPTVSSVKTFISDGLHDVSASAGAARAAARAAASAASAAALAASAAASSASVKMAHTVAAAMPMLAEHRTTQQGHLFVRLPHGILNLDLGPSIGSCGLRLRRDWHMGGISLEGGVDIHSVDGEDLDVLEFAVAKARLEKSVQRLIGYSRPISLKVSFDALDLIPLGNLSAEEQRDLQANSKRKATSIIGKRIKALVCSGDIDKLKPLLEEWYGNEVLNYSDAEDGGNTPLLSACASNRVDIVQLLMMQPGTDANRADAAGNTPLTLATQSGLQDIVLALLSHQKTDVNACDGHGRTAFMHAACINSRELCAVISGRSDLDPNAQDDDGKTALIHAASVGDVDLFKVLLEVHDIDADIIDDDGLTALEITDNQAVSDILSLQKSSQTQFP